MVIGYLDTKGDCLYLDGDVGVYQSVVKPQLAVSPVDVEVLDQEPGDDVPRVVRHVPCDPQLAHRGVDERVASLTELPSSERGVVRNNSFS